MILSISGGRAASFIVVLFFVVHRTTVGLTHYNYIVHLKVTFLGGVLTYVIQIFNLSTICRLGRGGRQEGFPRQAAREGKDEEAEDDDSMLGDNVPFHGVHHVPHDLQCQRLLA